MQEEQNYYDRVKKKTCILVTFEIVTSKMGTSCCPQSDFGASGQQQSQSQPENPARMS